MPNNLHRFNCFIGSDDYTSFLKLQKYYSRLFNKKITLTDTFLICLQAQAEENKKEIEDIQLDYDI